MTKKFGLGRAAALLLLAYATGCSSQSTAPYAQTTNNPFGAKVQMAVGTANIFGDDPLAADRGSGLNVVATSRQPAGYQTPGDTIPLVDTPSLTGPMVLPRKPGTPDTYGATVETGPGPKDADGDTMTGTPQQNSGAPSVPPSTFGVSGGVTGWGIEPYNYTVAGSNGFGEPVTYVPWTQPLFDAGQASSSGSSSNLDAFVPWGGPPAFDPQHDGKGARDGEGEPTGVLGTELGLDIFFGVTVHTGTYALGELIQTESASQTLHATAPLHFASLLPAISAPASATLDQAGGATFPLTVPAGVSETYLQVVDSGPLPATSSSGSITQAPSCNTASVLTPVYYTLFARGSGTFRLTLADNSGPGVPGSKVPSLCTLVQNKAIASSSSPQTSADVFGVQAIGFDYPAFEAAYPQSLGNPAPALAGAKGQSDITISAARTCTQSVAVAACGYSDSGSPSIRR